MVIDLEEKAKYTYGHLGEDSSANLPYRIYVDISGASLKEGVSGDIVIGDGLVEKVRSGRGTGGDPDSFRVVLETKGEVDYKIFSLIDPERIVVDVYKRGPAGS